jgi:hypothetical protein
VRLEAFFEGWFPRTVWGLDNPGQERKAVLSAGLGSPALGTTKVMHPDQRMLTLRRTRLAHR